MPRNALRPLAHALRSVAGTNGLADRVKALEAAVQQALARPLEATAASLPAAPAPAPAPSAPALDINLLLHHSRGALLRGMPPGAQRLVSAGCSGLWYFEWIQQTYGRVPEHLGIEYYSPKPDGLPDNVTWIANTASNMSAVQSATCDLVFSGQNLEHLWPDEVVGFMLEAARVLRAGGHLVIDSPNRILTAPLNWSHPEHTIELTHPEAVDLLHLAGFDVTASYGIWLCRDARTGKLLPFDPNQPVPGWSVTERLLVAHDRPADSFVWWIEAARSARPPDAAAMEALMAQLFRQHWPERIQRLIVLPGHGSHPSPAGEWVESAPGQAGVALHGPYMPLRAGTYRVTWQLQSAPGAPSPVAVCDVTARGRTEPLARQEVQPGDSRVSLAFTLGEMTFGLEFRCYSTGSAGFRVLRKIELEEGVS